MLKNKLTLVSSDTENDNNNSLETLEVIDNRYEYVKYKKIKDVLLPEIKKWYKQLYTKWGETKNEYAQSRRVSNCGR